MHLFVLFALLQACAPIEVSSSQAGCTDFTYSAPAEPAVEWAAEGEHAAAVWRTNVLIDQAGATFSPTFAIESGVLSVFEVWTDPASDATFCYQPEVHVSGISGSLEVRWYTPDDPDVPYQTIRVEP